MDACIFMTAFCCLQCFVYTILHVIMIKWRHILCKTALSSSSWNTIWYYPKWKLTKHHWYLTNLVSEAGISYRDKQLHPTVFCGMQLLDPVWHTCFWHQSPHLIHSMCSYWTRHWSKSLFTVLVSVLSFTIESIIYKLYLLPVIDWWRYTILNYVNTHNFIQGAPWIGFKKSVIWFTKIHNWYSDLPQFWRPTMNQMLRSIFDYNNIEIHNQCRRFITYRDFCGTS